MPCFRWLLGAWVILAVTGCASAPPVEPNDRLAIAPSDFAIDLTVLAPKVEALSTNPTIVQSRYVLFANGSLHHEPDFEHEKSQDWLPPVTRILTRQQMAEMWALANQLGFIRNKSQGEVANFKLAEPAAPGELAYLAGFTADGHRWTIQRRTPIREPDPAMHELANALARLAWADESFTGPVKMQPIRYDFGPDPYQRYRSTGANP